MITVFNQRFTKQLHATLELKNTRQIICLSIVVIAITLLCVLAIILQAKGNNHAHSTIVKTPAATSSWLIANVTDNPANPDPWLITIDDPIHQGQDSFAYLEV